MLPIYIPPSLVFMREHCKYVIAILEITGSADGRRIFAGDPKCGRRGRHS
jgi:hypothetical protein